MTRSLLGPSSPGALVDVMRMFGDQLHDQTNPQNNHLVHGISDTIDVMEYFRDLLDLLDLRRLRRLEDRLGFDLLDLQCLEDRLDDRLVDRLVAGRLDTDLDTDLDPDLVADLLADLLATRLADRLAMPDLVNRNFDLFIDDFKPVTQLLHTQDLQQKTCAQNAFLISSSCKFPKAKNPETHLALLKILCCSVRYAFTFTDPCSEPEIFFTNAIQCFLSNQSKPAHLQRELNVVEMILDPFFNQEYITDRDHAPGPFELKDRGILLKIFEEEGGLQALDRKFGAMLAQSAMPEELAPTTDFAHLVADQMIKTNTFDPLHLLDSAQKPPFTDDLSMLIRPLLYNSSGLQTICRLLKPLHEWNMAHLTWKEFVEQLRQWVVDKWEDCRPYNIGDIHRLPDLLLEDADELLADPQSTA